MGNQLSASGNSNQSETQKIVEQHLHMLSRLLASEAGYRGLYGGLTKSEIHARKGLGVGEEITDWMSPEELAINIFRASQAAARLRREQVQGQENIEQVHFQIGQLVRQTLAHIGNTMPEDLPVPTQSAHQALQDELRWLSQSYEFDSLERAAKKNEQGM